MGTRAGAEPLPRQGSRRGAELRPPLPSRGSCRENPASSPLLWPGCLPRPREGTTQPSDSPDLVLIQVAAGQLPGRASCGRQRPAQPVEEGVAFVFRGAGARQPPSEISPCSPALSLMTSPGTCVSSRCWRSWTCSATASGTVWPFQSCRLGPGLYRGWYREPVGPG